MDSSDVAKSPQNLAESTRRHCPETPEDRSTANEGALLEHSFQSVDLQTSSLTNLCGNQQTDIDVQKACEARWLRLFQLVERQCQSQIDAQQEQFNHQIQLIRNEIKCLIRSQGSCFPCSSSTGHTNFIQKADSVHLLKTVAEQQIQDEDRGENNSSPLHLLQEPDIQQRAFITQEHFLENTSVSSGYGTHSASEPNACLSSFSQNTSRLSTKQTLKECRTESIKHHDLKHGPVESEPPFYLVPGAKCPSPHLKNTSQGNHSNHLQQPHLNCDTINISKNNQPNSKSLTTWAHKQKQTSYKKCAKIDQTATSSSQSVSSPDRDLGFTDSSRNTFYLNRTESTNSLFSAGSGFTYWMLDEKDMYHPLPDSLEAKFSSLTAKEPEERIPSLTDIYQQKQRDCGPFLGWQQLSPSEHTHPPEVLTLDPTLHKKSSVHNTLMSKHGTVYSEHYGGSVTPDSISENLACNRSEGTLSSLLEDSSNKSLHSPDELWICNRNQDRRPMSYQLCHGDSSGDERMNCTEDEVNSLTPCSVPQSPLPFTEETVHHSPAIHVDHPVMLSNIRRSLREKNARHLADLREYYESEIANLKQQLIADNKSTASEDQLKMNGLSERCAQMEGALTEASKQIHILQNKNNDMEKQVVEWKERYYSANNTSKELQEQIEEMRERSKEKENAISRLQSRLKEVEESLEKALRKADDKEARINQEHKMFQDLLLEYESLGKEHERLKDVLSISENRLCDAHGEMNELRRTVAKLEKQTRQLEQQHLHITGSQSCSSNPNNDRLNMTGNFYTMDDVAEKCLTSGTDYSMFAGHMLDNKAKEMENKQDTLSVSHRYHCPPEKHMLHDTVAAAEPKTKEDLSSQESPILKALRDFEEERGLKNWNSKGNAYYELSCKKQMMDYSDFCTPRGSPESKARQRRVHCPSGPRSSSLPPSIRKSSTTPTKRELLLTPLTVKYSPKRSPSENLSPGLSPLLRDETTINRFDVEWENSSTFKDPSPRKRLQFMSLDDPEVRQKAIFNAESSSNSQLPLLPPFETEITYKERMKDLTDTERLFDQLTEEKKQIEAALSRMPGVGRRLSLQMRAKKETLEDRLEKINRDLGSIRMTLKKYHVLPTSANI